jgi:hypothetical protein
VAIWHLYRQSDGHLGLTYENLTTGALFKCGTLREDTPRAMVVAWVIGRGEAQTFDSIRLDTGYVLQVLPACRSRN